MKEPLERTAVLSQDVTDQPDEKYIVIVPELNIVLTADHVIADEDKVTLLTKKGVTIAVFTSRTPYIAVDRTRIDLVSRELQIRRTAANQKAEMELVESLIPPSNEVGSKNPKNGHITGGTGVYL